MAKDFSFEDIAGGGGAAPVAAPSKDFLTSMIEFVNRAITLASELNALITNAKTNLVPLIAEKVKSQMPAAGPGQNVAPEGSAALERQGTMTDPENVYKQILDGLVDLKNKLGDLLLSQVIAKMKENKGIVIAGIKAKIQAAKGADGGPPK